MPKPNVIFFQRRRRPGANFSLEFIFDDVRSRLKDRIDATLHVAPCLSNGLFRRLWIAINARWNQKQINHVTGDINFVAIALEKSRTVLTIHDCGFLNRSSRIRRWLLHKLWLELPVKFAGIVTTVSHAMKSEFVQKLGYDPGNLRVVHVAVSDRFQRFDHSFCEAKPHILHLGTAPNKNLERVMRALHEIPCKLTVVGVVDKEVQRLATQLNIQLTSHVGLSLEQIIQLYQSCDMLVFASTYEGFGMPIVEAQKTGRPVVTSNVASMPEVAGNGAVLVDPFSVDSIRNGILRVIQDAPLRQQLIEAGFENARRFDGDEIARQYLAIYEELAAKNPR